MVEILQIQTVGTVRYSPKLLGNQEKWWIVVDCDPGLGNYYRHLYWLARHRTERIQKPAWSDHITVVRNEEPPNKVAWMKHQGRRIEFRCGNVPRTNGLYWWLDVNCLELDKIREELGLSEPEIPFHLSFGHR